MQAASPALPPLPPMSPGGSTWEKTKRLISASIFGAESSAPPSSPPAVPQSQTPANKKHKNAASTPGGGAAFMTQANQTPKRTPQHSQQSADAADVQRSPVATNLSNAFDAAGGAADAAGRQHWLSPLLQPIKNIFFSPKKAAVSTVSVAASPAQAAADAAADAAAADDDDDAASVSSMDSVDERALDELEAFDEGENPFVFMNQCMSKRPKSNALCRPTQAPAALPRLTVVLDLDETLVHAKTEPMQGSDIRFSVNFDGQNYPVWVCRRPGVNEFVKQLSTFCDVIVFTASQKVYADQLLDVLEKMIGCKVIKSRYFRDSCVEVMGNYVKDLSVLDCDLCRTVIIDNSPQAFSLQVENGIPIKSWFGSAEEASDNRLSLLLPFLVQLSTARDVRPLVKKRFKMQQRIDLHGDKAKGR